MPRSCCRGSIFPDEIHDRKMGELQGGQKVRVLLAQALFGKPQALLLDEPTNYLDLDSIHWLQDFLVHFEGTLITISHDRHFLNSVCTHIADIDYETIITYTGGYDDMVMAKTQIRSRLESQNEQREKKIAQLNEFIARFSAGTRSSQVTSRKKEVERLQTTELARSNIARPYIRFDMLRPSGKHILEIEKLNKSYGDLEVIKDFSASVQRGEKIALMGRNGLGKTTLLKSLLVGDKEIDKEMRSELHDADFANDSGTVKWGHEAQIGYFPQDVSNVIENGLTVADWLYQFDPKATKEDIRGILGQMLFRGEEGLKKTDALSGGEAARLLFCKLMLLKRNILIFDEPTNHLDLESINALNVAIQRYEGTVLLVTHDHDLIDEVATRIWHFDHGDDRGLQGAIRGICGCDGGEHSERNAPSHSNSECAKPREVLRRDDALSRHLVHDQRGRPYWPDRAEWLGEVDAIANARRRSRCRLGRGRGPQAGAVELRHAGFAVRAGRLGARGHSQSAEEQRRSRERSGKAGYATRSAVPAFKNLQPKQLHFRVDGGNGWRLPKRWCRIPTCFCSMSQQTTLIWPGSSGWSHCWRGLRSPAWW